MIKQSEGVITVNPIKTDEATAAKRESDLCFERARNMVVKNQNEYESAAEFLKEIKTTYKTIDSTRKAITKPLDDSKKLIMDLFRDPLSRLEESEKMLKRSMIDYTNEQERIRREEQRKAEERARAEEERKRKELEKRSEKWAEKGNVEKAEALKEQAEDVHVPVEVIEPTTEKPKGIAYVEVWKFEIEDTSKIPVQYMIPDEKMIGQVVRSTKGKLEIPGIKIYSEKTVRA